jgi:predicted benzoate:H+ symporter BenE
MKRALTRAVNELPTAVAGVAAILYVFGVDLAEATVADVVEQGEAVLAFALWLYVRSQTDGPATRAEQKTVGLPGEMPDFIDYREPS